MQRNLLLVSRSILTARLLAMGAAKYGRDTCVVLRWNELVLSTTTRTAKDGTKHLSTSAWQHKEQAALMSCADEQHLEINAPASSGRHS